MCVNGVTASVNSLYSVMHWPYQWPQSTNNHTHRPRGVLQVRQHYSLTAYVADISIIVIYTFSLKCCVHSNIVACSVICYLAVMKAGWLVG